MNPVPVPSPASIRTIAGLDCETMSLGLSCVRGPVSPFLPEPPQATAVQTSSIQKPRMQRAYRGARAPARPRRPEALLLRARRRQPHRAEPVLAGLAEPDRILVWVDAALDARLEVLA